MSDEVRAEIIALIAEHTGIVPSRLTDTARLAEDLGIGSGEAWDLIGAIAERFAIDVDALDRDWKLYYPPDDAWGCSRLAVILACAFVSGISAAALDLPDIAGLGIWVALMLSIEVIAQTLRKRVDPLPITIATIVRAAESGRWPNR